LINSITQAIQEGATAGASSSENAMLQAVKELTSEIRLFRLAFMHSVSALKTPGNILILIATQKNIAPAEEEQVPASVARHFTSTLS
jgi:hypothetical protein